jgi:hypothetical protein
MGVLKQLGFLDNRLKGCCRQDEILAILDCDTQQKVNVKTLF